MSRRVRIATLRAAAGTAPAASAVRIDREAGIIYGASAMQAVEALGHGMTIDATTLRQVADLGNAAKNGIKSRFTHPGLCSDGMGKYLGRQRSFRVDGDKVVGDLHLSDAAAKAPDGDLRSYVLDLAEEDPAAFGMSVVISLHTVWRLADGSEIASDDPSLRRGQGDTAYFARPDTATTDLPLCRVDDLHASDVVDEPAANRDGIFSAAFTGTTSLDADAAFAALDEVRQRLGLGAADLRAFLDRYLTTRGLTSAASPQQDTHPMKITPAELAALCDKHPAQAPLIVKLAAEGKDAKELQAAIDAAALGAQLAATKTEIETLKAQLSKVQTDAAAALKSEVDAHAATKAALAKAEKIAGLGGSAPKDPGGSPTPTSSETDPLAEANLKSRWETDAKLRESFGGDFAALTALAKDDKRLARQALGI